MRKLSALIAVTTIMAAPAFAADLGKKPGAPVLPVMASYTWTGFYVGANAGYAFGEQRTRLGLGGQWATEAAALQNAFRDGGGGNLRGGGFIGGVQAGYNQQYGRVVVGGEVDINFFDIRKRTANTLNNAGGFPGLTYNFTRRVDTDWLITIRPRVGYAFDRTLLYVTGGLAIAQVKDNWSVASSGNYLKAMSNSSVRAGFTVGAGVEHAFTRNWTAKLEYLYTDLGRASKSSVYLPGSAFVAPAYTEQVRTRFSFHTVRVGLNYKF
ncbi:MAG: porin family protein [Beijerinckiaceae bacterium]|nr:porin family protein [Beijerinckiaceae bacterium]MCZ8301873.1 porin family protein [Beijerinckiaceae bacterium]